MIKKIVMPAAGQTTDAATVVSISAAVGDKVKRGDVLCEVETDKATLPIESVATGLVCGIFVKEYDTVDAGTLLMEIGDEDDLAAATAKPGDAPAPEAEPEPEPAVAEEIKPVEPSEPAAALSATEPAAVPEKREPASAAFSGFPAMPNAKEAAARLGVDLGSVTPSNGSFIKKADVEAAAKPAATGDDTLPTSVMRDMLSGKLERSAVPAAFLTVEASAESAVRVASAISARGRVKVTPGDLVLLALAKLADRFPCVAVRNEHGSLKKTDCMAFAFTGINGTVSAAVRGVSQMTLSQIAAEREKNAEMLSRGDMTPEGGASLTVFDLSDSDTDGCLPVLSAPEVAALSIGGIKTRPYAEDGLIKSRESFILTLAFDARVIDVPVAAELLSQLSGLVEDPALML